jgi:hypothetical protein
MTAIARYSSEMVDVEDEAFCLDYFRISRIVAYLEYSLWYRMAIKESRNL